MALQLKRLLLDARTAGIARQPNILALPFRVGWSQGVDDFLEHSPCGSVARSQPADRSLLLKWS